MSTLTRLLLATYISSVTYYLMDAISSTSDWFGHVWFVLYVLSIAIGWFFWIATKDIETEKDLVKYILSGAGILGLGAVMYGIIIPAAILPGAGQEVLAGLLYIVPLGAIIGGVSGVVFWVFRQRKIEGAGKCE